MAESSANVFDSIESAHEYVGLLCDAVDEASATISGELGSPVVSPHKRQIDALRLVDYKLKALRHHLVTSRLLLNDLRTLRRYMFEERKTPEAVGTPASADADRH